MTGKVVNHPLVNVNNAIMIGEKQMEEFEKSWPDGFHDTFFKDSCHNVNYTKSVINGDVKIFDMETTYARALALQSGQQSLNINTIMSHELTPYPTSMFNKNGKMREVKTKANLKNALKVDVSTRNSEKDVKAIFLDGCAVLKVISWPMFGIVQDYLD